MARPRGTGSIYRRKGSNIWWIKFYQNGRAFRQSTRTTSEKLAIRLLQQRLGAVATGVQLRPNAERILMSELWEDFKLDYRNNHRKSLEDAEARWRIHLKPFFAHVRAVDLGTDQICRYIDHRMTNKAANATINRELSIIKRMLSLGRKSSPAKVTRMLHIAMLKEDNVRKGFLSDAEFDLLADQCAAVGLWLRAMLEVGATYGWRLNEIKKLRVRQVDIDGLTIRLDPGTTKNREGRVVSIVRGSKVQELLKACVAGKGSDDYVFTRTPKKPILDFRESWARCCEAAGKPGLLFHDLRRTAARNLRRAGIAEGIIMAIGGWRTRTVFERYAIVKEGDISDAMRQLEDYRAEQRARNLADENGHSPGTVKGSERVLEADAKPN